MAAEGSYEHTMDEMVRHCIAIGRLSSPLMESVDHLRTDWQREIADALVEADAALLTLRRCLSKARIAMEMDGLVPPK